MCSKGCVQARLSHELLVSCLSVLSESYGLLMIYDYV